MVNIFVIFYKWVICTSMTLYYGVCWLVYAYFHSTVYIHFLYGTLYLQCLYLHFMRKVNIELINICISSIIKITASALAAVLSGRSTVVSVTVTFIPIENGGSNGSTNTQWSGFTTKKRYFIFWNTSVMGRRSRSFTLLISLSKRTGLSLYSRRRGA